MMLIFNLSKNRGRHWCRIITFSRYHKIWGNYA